MGEYTDLDLQFQSRRNWSMGLCNELVSCQILLFAMCALLYFNLFIYCHLYMLSLNNDVGPSYLPCFFVEDFHVNKCLLRHYHPMRLQNGD